MLALAAGFANAQELCPQQFVVLVLGFGE